MGIDFDRVLGKLEKEKERKASEKDLRLAKMDREDRQLVHRLADLSRDLVPPDINVGTRLYKPVFRKLFLSKNPENHVVTAGDYVIPCSWRFS